MVAPSDSSRVSDSTTKPRSALADLAIDRTQRPDAARRSWIVPVGILFVAGVLTGAGWWYYRTTGVNIVAALSERPADVNVMVIAAADEARQQPIALVASGRIVSDLQVKIATKVSGQIVELNVEQGDVVAAGQILARVEKDTYQARRDEAAALVQRRESEVARAEAEHARARADVDQRKAEHEFEKRNYERLRRLRNDGQADDFEFYNSKNRYEAALAAWQAAQSAAQSAEILIAMARAERNAAQAVLDLNQKRLDDCAIRAPIAGVVLERNAQLGDFLAAEGGRGANANAQLVEIADMTRLRVEVDISERDIRRVTAGQHAIVTPDADRAQTYDGRVLWVDPLGDYAKATVQVKVRILNPGPDLRVGGSARVEFLGANDAAVAQGGALPTQWLPKSAVKLKPGSDDATVFTVSDGRAVACPVKIGARSDKTVEVRQGVHAGMRIVADNVDALTDGHAVKVVRTLAAGEL